MSVQVEKLEKNMAKLTIEVSAEDFDKAMKSAYEKQKNKINMPGFRKGKVPMNMVIKMYGPEMFYEDAANIAMQESYPKAYDECGEDIVSAPEVDVVQIEMGKPFIYTATVALKPVVTLGEYKGVEVAAVDKTVSDEDVDAEITRALERNGRDVEITDRPVADGDTVKIDFKGYIDGEAFDGGEGTDYDLKIGSHSFIDGFEDQLIGKEISEDEIDVNVTFPEDYHVEELKGKPALFKVVIKAIKAKEIPLLDDEFVADTTDFETVDEYKADVRAKLEERKAVEVKNAITDEAMDKIIDASEMEIPEVMIKNETDSMMNEYANNLMQQGISMEMYMQYTNDTEEGMRERLAPQALKRIQTELILENIVKAEGIEASDEEADAELQKMADAYGMTLEDVKGYFGPEQMESIKRDVKFKKALDLVAEAVKEV